MIEKVVLDSNALIQIMGAHSKYNVLWKRFMERRFILCISNEIMMEYEEMLKQKSSPLVADMFIKMLSLAPNVLHKEPYYQYRLVEQDLDDNKFVDCAIAANASYIVTDDRHFDILENIPFPSVDICTLEMFYMRYASITPPQC